MSNYMCSGSCDKTPVYCLYAVIVHVDIMNAAFSGHYVCYVKNTQNKWYKIDDSMVCSLAVSCFDNFVMKKGRKLAAIDILGI